MTRAQKAIRSDIAWSTRDRIAVRGLDLPNEILGHVNLGDFAYLHLTGKRPTGSARKESDGISACLAGCGDAQGRRTKERPPARH